MSSVASPDKPVGTGGGNEGPRPQAHQSSSTGNPGGSPDGNTGADRSSQNDGGDKDDGKPSSPLPSINLPKGGGAIRDIGEKFSVNAATGTGSMSVPIAFSPSRSGLGPSLALSYDSGSGNGPFGLGWQLSIPAITRKTDKGLPMYRDEEESDVFILAGAEDLVPVLAYEDGSWVRQTPTIMKDGGVKYEVRRYRPRVEGSFMRIERWTDVRSRESHWRTINTTNVTSVFGDSSNSRVFDPSSPKSGPARIFKWLLSRSYDDKGNVFVHEYKAEDSSGVDPNAASEQHRTPTTRSAQRYLKRVKYGNRVSRLVDSQGENPDWMFEAVLDYGEHVGETPSIHESRPWLARPDPFSTYRSCFEVRTYRLCQRILMFHHFPLEENIGQNCLVSALEMAYCETEGGRGIASFVSSLTQRAYQRNGTGGFINKALRPVEFQYSQPAVSRDVHDLDPESLKHLPFGLDDSIARWLDLNGDGLPGVLTKQGDAYYYQPNLGSGKLGPMEDVTPMPTGETGGSSHEQWMSLSADGHMDLVNFGGNNPGFYRRLWTTEGGWEEFQPFKSLPSRLATATAIQYLDLNGDGLTDVLIADDDVFTWYPSIGEVGYGDVRYARTPVSDEHGARLLVSDATQAIYTADMSGDGLQDLVRIRNGDICYWPNIGYGLFGPRVAMDNSPFFDHDEAFLQSRIRLFDIDGSGTTDVIYLGRDGAQYYQNASGNGFTRGHKIESMPRIDNSSKVQVVDLFGRGTGFLVWSSTLPADFGRQVRYIDLMGSEKPHLLISYTNNLGAETRVHYSTSVEFYLRDKAAGRPWPTRLAFPVQVVERQETFDYISKSLFVSRYTYHDGFFDGVEREYHGFGMVEQLDTEDFAALSGDTTFPSPAANLDATSHIPPALTRTWFHTGAYFQEAAISRYNAAEYWREPGLSEEEADAMLLADTALPTAIRRGDIYIPHALSTWEAREACRALKGQVLRTETYALDGSEAESRPYSAREANYVIEALQPLGSNNKHAMFFVHPKESVDLHYERALFEHKGRRIADPRVSHSLTLRTNEFGDALLAASITYGRRVDVASPHLTEADRRLQKETQVLYTVNKYTNEVWGPTWYRKPVHYEDLVYQLINFTTWLSDRGPTGRFSPTEVYRAIEASADGRHDLPYEDWQGLGTVGDHVFRRGLSQSRTLFRSDDLSRALPLGELEPLGIEYESFQKAISPALARETYISSGKVQDDNQLEKIMLESGFVRLGEGGDGNEWVLVDPPKDSRESSPLRDKPDKQDEGDWWIPTGRSFFSPNSDDSPETELQYARKHFFQPLRHRDPFYSDSHRSEWFVSYDRYDLLLLESRDPLGNITTAGERAIDPNQPLLKFGLDYRLLKPVIAMDLNRNRVSIMHDVLGNVVASAMAGKPEDTDGDTLDGVDANLSDAQVAAAFADPLDGGTSLLGNATVRFIYDIYAFARSPLDEDDAPPTRMQTIARETHTSALAPGEQSRLLFNVSYFDGFSRTIQSKTYAGPGRLYRSDIARDEEVVPHRWICNGWTIYDNKGNAVRKYEPYYSAQVAYEFGVAIGVTSTVFYDPLQRVVATLFPDNSWSKTIFSPWESVKWDANDTVLANPLEDPDVGDFFRRLFPAGGSEFSTWYAQRIGGAKGLLERQAAEKAAAHADTPTLQFLDALGRMFLTVEHNRKDVRAGRVEDEFVRDTTVLDVEGHKRALVDALGRTAARFDWDMSGTKIHHASMEAGELWMLHDVLHGLVFGWDSRGQRFRTEYDLLRRSIDVFLSRQDEKGKGPFGPEMCVERTIYGETVPNPEAKNLRGHVYHLHDQSGIVSTEMYDFKGNILVTQRQLAEEYKGTLDWSAGVPLEQEQLVQTMAWDAVNRKIQETTADNSTLYYARNDVGLIQRIEVKLGGAEEKTVYLSDIEYNARGQRMWIAQGNQTVTINTYDEETFRPENVVTHKNCRVRAGRPAPDAKSSVVQSLHYVYDPIGNVTHIRDEAQQSLFFRNKLVDPSGDFTYDPLYRLIRATGREQLGQSAGRPGSPRSGKSSDSVSRDHAHDETAMARYTELYSYDAAGNVLWQHHDSADATRGSWTKHFAYEEPSQIEPDKVSNRLTSARRGAETQRFAYDGLPGRAGNPTAMSELSRLDWDYKNQLAATSRQVVADEEAQTPETTYYRYDSRGQRVRKVTERHGRSASSSGDENEKSGTQGPVKLKERVYFGQYEVFRRYAGDGSTLKLERQTLHIADEAKAFVLVETRTVGEEKKNAPRRVSRYQLSNAINSVQVELDQDGALLSYEEYSPYGDTTYSAWNGALGPPKRYRYSGKERDEESGLYYYGARYYHSSTLRFLNPDPGGLKDGPNLYQFVRGNPISKSDAAGTEGSWFHRAMGVAQAIGGAVEIAAGVAGIMAPTGVTQVLGAVAVVHGADTAWAGLKQAWTGEEQKTYTQQGATKLAEAAGASHETAEKIGVGVDIAVGLLPDAGAALLKGGSKLVGKLSKAATAVKEGAGSLAKVATEGAKTAVKLTVEAGRELVATGKAVVAHTGQLIDDAAQAVKGMSLATENGLKVPGAYLSKAFEELSSGSKAAVKALKSDLTGAEHRLANAVEEVEKFKSHWVGKTQRHHIFPKTKDFRDFFERVGINVHDYTFELNKAAHRIIHGNANKYLREAFEHNWNAAWEKFIATEGKTASKEDVEKFAYELMNKTGITKYFRDQGSKWINYFSP